MPRAAKRQLAENDGNANDGPAPKRQSLGAEAGANKENAPATKGKGKATKKATSAAAKYKEARDEYFKDQKEIEDKVASAEGIEYICVPRPWKDRRKEWEEDEEIGEDPSKAILDKAQDENKEYAGNPRADHPDWIWTLSRAANYWALNSVEEAEKRDQDNFDMHIYNDWSGYGCQEVCENQLKELFDALKKPAKEIQRLWAYVEALGFWLYESDSTFQWHGIDDGERLSQTIELIGCGLLSALNALEREKVLVKDSVIPNIGLVLSLYLDFADTFGEDHFDEVDNPTWPEIVVAYAKAHDIEIKGAYGIEEVVEKFNDLDPNDIPNKPGKDRWQSAKKLTAYTRSYGNKGKIGGSQYDIFKMPLKDRKGYNFEGVDPLDRADPDHIFH